MLTEQDISSLSAAFATLAPSGQIPPASLPNLLRSLGQFPTEAEIQELLITHPVLDLQTVLKLVDMEVDSEVDQIFALITKSSTITRDDLKVAFGNVGIKVDESEIGGMIDEIGEISLEVFRDLVTTTE